MSRCLAVALLVAALPAAALKSDRGKPMNVAADRFETTEDQDAATLDGNVRITQGTLDVTADHAQIEQADQDIKRVVLTGAPAKLEQDLDDGGRLVARAREIDYDLGTDRVVLTGGVVIQQPRGELRGDRVVYELSTGKITGSGEGEQGRVHIRVDPVTKKSD
jgi:lipopolysaccharide export system protein LptA